MVFRSFLVVHQECIYLILSWQTIALPFPKFLPNVTFICKHENNLLEEKMRNDLIDATDLCIINNLLIKKTNLILLVNQDSTNLLNMAHVNVHAAV